MSDSDVVNTPANTEILSGELRLEILRNRILEELKKSGFSIVDNKTLVIPEEKEYFRKVHENAVEYLREKKSNFILKNDERMIDKYIIDGKTLDIKNIQPLLIPIVSKEQSDLFNWTKLHWSIPTSSGYGRRLRYLVYDKGNSSLIGIIGLADPVFALKGRDNYIGWSPEVRKKRLKHVMDAFVLGAVPPYSFLLGGKLVGSLITSTKISNDFKQKYGGKPTLISNEIFDGKLAAITTASALGKSSVYDRIRIEKGSQFIHVGWTKGSGEFQFINGVYQLLFELAHSKAEYLKNPKWGNGTRNRRTVVRTGLKMLNLSQNLIYHNVKRELFLVPLGTKSIEFLRGDTKLIEYYNKSTDDISEFALKRWIVPRSERRKEYIQFSKEKYSLLNKSS